MNPGLGNIGRQGVGTSAQKTAGGYAGPNLYRTVHVYGLSSELEDSFAGRRTSLVSTIVCIYVDKSREGLNCGIAGTIPKHLTGASYGGRFPRVS
jgi:hypothetical protein